MNHIKTNRDGSGKLNVLDVYAYWVAGTWLVAALAAIALCYIIALLIWHERPSRLPAALAISTAIMMTIWIGLAVKARRRGYADVRNLRLEVAFLLSLVLFMSLCSLFDLSKTTRYLLVIPFTAIWVAVHLSVRRARKSLRRKE
ncbi:MAG: hypothetical protein JW759_07745 [Candidatus Coatesbacteria bacterium]|nr:hypothetical protein [Candidatus Coatesbacteria bacterium]